jgi:AcrR family transcriptional regulator
MALAESERNSNGNRQQERRLATRAKLVDAAIKLLNQKGAAQLTTEEVAREAGLTRGAIQYHFDSPKSLLIESIVEIADRLSQHLDVEPLSKLPLGDRIDRVVDDYWRGFGGDTYAAFIEIAMRGRQDPDFEAAITDALQELEKKRAVTWVKVFADTGKTKEEIMSWRSTLLIMLRGMALTNMIDNHRDIVVPQIDLFKDMFKKYLIDQ